MTAAAAPNAFVLSPLIRAVLIAGGVTMTAVAGLAVAKGLTGLAPTPVWVKSGAIAVHLAAVLPAIPLGLWLMLARKGDARHRMLGKAWMVLMLVTAFSALFIRHLNGGSFSFIHLFVPLTIFTIVRAVMAARQGQIAAHRAHLVRLYLLGLLLPGLFSFMPGRVMWTWLMG